MTCFRAWEDAVNSRGIVVGLVLMLGVAAAGDEAAKADPQVEFTVAYNAYREAMEASQYAAAVMHAEEARALGEQVFADNDEVMATLALNHGLALSKAGAKSAAYPVLKEARKLVAQAFGHDSERLFQLELALFDNAPQDAASWHLTSMLKLARLHHREDSESMAALKLHAASLAWWDQRAKGMLREAAAFFARSGQTEREAHAMFFIGKIDVGRERYRNAVEAMTRVVNLLPAEHATALMARANLVDAYEHLGESERATEHCLAIGQTTPWGGTADYQPLFKRPPAYPRGPLFRNLEGYVLLEFSVDKMGFVRDPSVIESSVARERGAVWREFVGEFEAAAIDAARKFRYAPKFVDGKPVTVDGVRNLIRFELSD